METDILVGFKNSEILYGIKYSKLIAGGSSTYKKFEIATL